MIIYKPDNKVFKTMKEAKQYLGVAFLRKMQKTKDERLIIIDTDCIASDESIYKTAHHTEESNQ